MSISANAIPKKAKIKNPGGRPRVNTKGSHGTKTSLIKWVDITDPPGSTNNYQVSSEGQVQRLLKSGRYKPVKAWTTGGPYAAVYLYGFPNVTRHRKKVYVHRLVATHFIKDKKPGEVVHHLKGPSNNQARNLDWVSVEDNLKARKFLGPDGKPRPKGTKKVINNVLTPNAKKTPPAAKAKAWTDKAPKPLPQADNLPDREEFIPNTETLKRKIKYLTKTSKEFLKAWAKTKKVIPQLKASNLADLHKEATGKGVKITDKMGPAEWKTRLLSALYAIKTRLKT
jgi:hypothetical protein